VTGLNLQIDRQWRHLPQSRCGYFALLVILFQQSGNVGDPAFGNPPAQFMTIETDPFGDARPVYFRPGTFHSNGHPRRDFRANG